MHLLPSSVVAVFPKIEEIASSAQFGDLIEFSYPIGYSHWAVYDDDKHVIHFAVAGEQRSPIDLFFFFFQIKSCQVS